MSEQEKIKVAVIRACELMVESGLGDWKIELNKKRTSLAETYQHQKTIKYSRYFLIKATKEDLEGVSYHEIAHALLGAGHGHDKTFRELCTRLAGTDKYASRQVDIPLRRYRYTCPNCGASGGKNIKRQFVCGKCSKRGKTSIFDVKENIIAVHAW